MRRSIIQNDSYQEDVESSANKLYRRSSGTRGYASSIVSNVLGEWRLSPLITMYSYSL